MASLRKAINYKCKDCIYDPEEKSSWKQQVTDCTENRCPLYNVRPIKGPKRALSQENKA